MPCRKTAIKLLCKEFETLAGNKVVVADLPFKKNDIKVDNATIHAIKTVIV